MVQFYLVSDIFSMITLQEVSKTFHKDSPQEVKALQRVSLHIPRGQFVILIGSNGSGKSTLLNTLAGSVRPDSGQVLFEGRDVTRHSEHQRARWVSRVFQNPLQGTAPGLSVLDNFRLAALRTKGKHLRLGIDRAFVNVVKEKIALLGMGLEDKVLQPMGQFSGGQRQALTLAMAVMDEAKLLLMDEPTAALDPKSAENLMRKIDEIVKQFDLTAVLVTHNLKYAHQYGQRLLQMQEGQLVRDLQPDKKSTLEIETYFQWFTV
ncbi:ABC transporter ATP-binding protein [Eisenibacter elegans]|jgi:putative ABC transport system ATP-binding protein|uniref:ABC transporter ATP-binding protein n=1 Tax=Eisenibacter elegans TaxID=997 RepID=UPI0004256BE3|nr:ATP-binding cassette domain-containing protein [Eisenibacter elegans]